MCLVARLEGELATVEALRDLKSELIQQKQVIVDSHHVG